MRFHESAVKNAALRALQQENVSADLAEAIAKAIAAAFEEFARQDNSTLV